MYTRRAWRFSVWGQRFFFGRCCQIRSSSEMHGTHWEHACVHVHAHTSKYWGFLELCLQSIKVNSARTGFGQTNEYSWLSECVCVCLYQRRGKSKLWVRKRRNKRITRFRAERGQDIRRGQEVEWYRSSHNSLGSRCTCYLLPPLQLYTPPPYMIQPSSSLISITSRITLPFMTISLMWIHSGGSFLWRIIAMSWVFITK